ncbi:MAG: dTMP kinase [Candidatus Aenigmarchaeota archaeon]|nr:dTMP kinase [Candidatus Aenigmarchaeota archaeon]
MKRKRGLFISFEGPDGSGESTQSDLLAKWFKKNKMKVFKTKEPTNNIIGGIIRTILKKEWKVDLKTFALLFTADRAHHVNTEIEPLLKKGVNVISDRYMLSTFVYESDGIPVKWLKQLNDPFPKPDLTFVLDVPGKICVERIAKSRFGFELFEKEKQLEEIRNRYKKMEKILPNVFIIKGYDRTPKEIHEEIVDIVKKHL